MRAQQNDWRDYFRVLLADHRFAVAHTVRVLGIGAFLYPFVVFSLCGLVGASCSDEVPMHPGYLLALAFAIAAEGYERWVLRPYHEDNIPEKRGGLLERYRAWWAVALERGSGAAVYLIALAVADVLLVAAFFAMLSGLLLQGLL